MNSDSLEKASSEFTSVNDRKKPENEKNEDATLQRGDFTIKAYNSYDSMSEFISGENKMVEGEVSEDFSLDNCKNGRIFVLEKCRTCWKEKFRIILSIFMK